MVILIKNRKLFVCIILFFLYGNSSISAQDLDACKLLNIVGTTGSIHPHDTVQVHFKSDYNKNILFVMEVMEYRGKEWFYSDIFTMYFNHIIKYNDVITYINESGKTKFSFKDSSIITYKIGQTEEYKNVLVLDHKSRSKRLLKLRFHILKDISEGGGNCFLYSEPFYFGRLKNSHHKG